MKNPTHNQMAQVVAMFLSSSDHSLAYKFEIITILKTTKEVAGASLETITPDTSGVTTHLSHRLPMSSSNKS